MDDRDDLPRAVTSWVATRPTGSLDDLAARARREAARAARGRRTRQLAVELDPSLREMVDAASLSSGRDQGRIVAGAVGLLPAGDVLSRLVDAVEAVPCPTPTRVTYRLPLTAWDRLRAARAELAAGGRPPTVRTLVRAALFRYAQQRAGG